MGQQTRHAEQILHPFGVGAIGQGGVLHHEMDRRAGRLDAPVNFPASVGVGRQHEQARHHNALQVGQLVEQAGQLHMAPGKVQLINREFEH